MSEQEIDDYLAGLGEPQRSTLEALRSSILAVVPDAEQCISYGMPAFRVEGKLPRHEQVNSRRSRGDEKSAVHSGRWEGSPRVR